MIKRIVLSVALALSALPANPGFAHDLFRVTGTVITPQERMLIVKTREGKTLSVRLIAETVYFRNNSKVSAAELKPGTTVAINALGDSEEELEATEIWLLPPLPALAP
jgi:hypothetical protein